LVAAPDVFYAPCLTIGSYIHKNMSMNCELFMGDSPGKCQPDK